jgi:hypothetical protein
MVYNTKNNRVLLLVFSFFLIINIASSGGHFDAHDGVETFLVTESMVLKHSAMLYPDVPSIGKLNFDINSSVATNKAFHPGVYALERGAFDPAHTKLEPMYVFRSLLSAAIAVPFYYAAVIFSVPPIPVVGLFLNSLIISLICVVVFCFSLEVYNSRKISFVLSLMFGVCSFIWPYDTSLFPEPLQTLCIFTSAYFIYISTKQSNTGSIIIGNNNNNTITTNTNKNNKKAYFAGLSALFLGLSVFAHPTSILLIPAFIAYSIYSMRHSKKSITSFFIILGIMLGFIGLVNYWRFGSFSDFGYGYWESLSTHGGWKGLIGLLVSPGAGLIFYFPIAILLPIALKYMYRMNKGLFFLSTYVILGFWFYFGTMSYNSPSSWTGNGWGPRYLVPILPFITIVSGTILVHAKNGLFFKVSIITLCAAGFYVNLLGSLVWYQYGYSYGWERDALWKYERHITNENSYDIMTWVPDYSPIVLNMKVLTSNYLSTLPHSEGYMVIGLAPCSYDDYLYCKFGIIPVLLLFVVLVILGALTISEINKFNPIISSKRV